jgi:replicative DNA helicase
MTLTDAKAPAQRGNAGGGTENHVGAGLAGRIPLPTDRYLAALDAEAAFVGAVMHQPAPAALDALSLVKSEDFADLWLSVVADACRELAGRGIAPDPTAVLAHIRASAVVTGSDAIRSLSLLLAELYGTVPTPASVRWYRLAVLDGALRRWVEQMAARLGQAAENESIDSLLPLVGREVVAVGDVQQRRTAAEAVGQ